MALLERSRWYDLARSTNWTPTYVREDEIFPPDMSDVYGLGMDTWETYDEPYKVSFRDYVRVQREKDTGVYAVREALARSDYYEKADPGWMTVMKAHYGGVTTVEFASASTQARMGRFGKAGGLRNMGAFGSLDEIRHTQTQLVFSHEHLQRGNDPEQFAWSHYGNRTNNWVNLAVRHTFEDIEHTRDVVETAVMTSVFEVMFTNLQFIGLAADAAKQGDHRFSSLIQSIQSDEARHAQIGMEVMRLMVREGRRAEVQRLVDISFWRNWRAFAPLTGIAMDYYMPVERREHSFKEFMEEWVIAQFDRTIGDLGLARPWYWDIFLDELEWFVHGQHLGVWLLPNTVWWNPPCGVTPAERDWLEQKYPGWNATFGRCWDVITKNVLDGKLDKIQLEIFPLICHMSNLAITGIAGDGFRVKDHYLDYEGRRYHFGSEVDRWIFLQEPNRYKDYKNILDRYMDGTIQPPTNGGFLAYMGLNEHSWGRDPHNWQWNDRFRARERRAS
jgi:toluene monooxygenase system protein A